MEKTKPCPECGAAMSLRLGMYECPGCGHEEEPAAPEPEREPERRPHGPGFRREVAGLVGGSLGCTHLRELLGRMATTAFQTIYPIKAREIEGSTTKHTHLLGTCHAYAPGSEVVRRIWPELKEA